MKALSKRMVLPTKEYYVMHLSIINILLPKNKLTPKEIEVLASFMSLTGDISKDRFGSTAKKLIREELGLSDGGLSNYIKALKDKGFIVKDEILAILNPNLQKQEYFLQIINSEYESID